MKIQHQWRHCVVTFIYKVREQQPLPWLIFLVHYDTVSVTFQTKHYHRYSNFSVVDLHLGFWYRRLRKFLHKKVKKYMNCSMKKSSYLHLLVFKFNVYYEESCLFPYNIKILIGYSNEKDHALWQDLYPELSFVLL